MVCLDGSAEAAQILPYITGDSHFAGSQLLLFRAVNLPSFSLPLNVPGEPGVPLATGADIKQMAAREQEADAYLESVAVSLRQQGFDVVTEAMPGTPGEIIVHYATDAGVTLIAIATHGHGVARRFFLGSTADYVIRHSGIPVLVVHPR